MNFTKRRTQANLFVILTVFLSICYSFNAYCQKLPIVPMRTISFETDEGTNMSVDLSPNGKLIVFDLLGDIYTVPLEGGRARQLTRGIANNSHPVWSPDGRRIACKSDASGIVRVSYIDSDGGSPIALTSENDSIDRSGSLIWNPDGKFIIADGNQGIAAEGIRKDRGIYSISGLKTHLFNSGEIKDAKVFGFSQKSQSYFYFKDNSSTKDRDVVIYSYNPDSALPKRLGSVIIPNYEYEYGFGNFRLSPNARWLTYMFQKGQVDTACNLILQDLESGQSRILIPSVDRQNFIPQWNYCFTKDSKQLLIAYDGKIHRINMETGENKIIPFQANVHVDCGPFNYNFFPLSIDSLEVKYSRFANLNSSGKQLVFCSLNRIYIKDLDKDIRPLVKQDVDQYMPSFSPDGSSIVYATWSDTEGGSVWKVGINGGKPERYNLGVGKYSWPTWSPDGKVLAVIKAPLLTTQMNGYSRSTDIGKLILISDNNSTYKIVDDSAAITNQQITFSQDGKRLYYAPAERSSPYARLVSRNLEGGDELIVAVSNCEFPHNVAGSYEQLKPSPNGRYIIYRNKEDLFILPTGVIGQPILLCDDNKNISAIRFARGAVDPFWDHSGKKIGWSYGNRIYIVSIDKIFSTANDVERSRPTTRFSSPAIIDAPVIPDEEYELNVKVKKFYGNGILALTNARIITMNGDKIFEKGTLTIHDGRIVDINSSSLVRIPRDAVVYDLGGKTIIPGLIDMHWHIRKDRELYADISPQQPWKALVNLSYGITTVRNPSGLYQEFGQAELIETGNIVGPRLFSVGQRIAPGLVDINSFSDAQAVVTNRYREGATCVKQYELETRLQRNWLLLAAKQAGLNMTNERGDALGMIKDGNTGVEHDVFQGKIYKDVITLISKSGIFLTPTLQETAGVEPAMKYFHFLFSKNPDKKLKRFTPPEVIQRMIEKANPKDSVHPYFIEVAKKYSCILRNGGMIALSSHGNDPGIGVHNELWAFQMGGMSNMEALQCGTITAARALGMQKDIGSIEVGKIADLIILNANPLEDIRNSTRIKYVMKDGVLYNGETLDMEWPIKKKLPTSKLFSLAN
jgi:Tol biopolymer transport system component